MDLQVIPETRPFLSAMFTGFGEGNSKLNILGTRPSLPKVNFQFDLEIRNQKPGIVQKLEKILDELQSSKPKEIENCISRLMQCMAEIENILPAEKVRIERTVAEQIHLYIINIRKVITALDDFDKSVWDKTERISRVLSNNEPNKFWWFGEKGEIEDLDLLHEIKIGESQKIKEAITQAQHKIIKRLLKKLLNSFGLNEAELLSLTEEMIQNRNIDGFAALPEIFVPQNIAQALLQLNTLRTKIGLLIKKDDIDDWLEKPHRALRSKSPVYVIKLGKAFLVLQILLRLEEGFH